MRRMFFFDRVLATFGYCRPTLLAPNVSGMSPSAYLTAYDRIVKTMQLYIDGSKQGKSS